MEYFPLTTYVLYFFIFFYILYLYATRNFNYWKEKCVPFLKPTPFFGNTPKMLLLQTTVGQQLAELYCKSKEPLLGFFIGDRPSLLLRSPELIKHILIKDFNHFPNRTMTHNFKKDPLGSNILFTILNPGWRNIRPKVTPLFTSVKIKQMFLLMLDVAKNLEDHTKQNLISKEVDAKWLCQKFTIDVISSCAFGMETNSVAYENSELYLFAMRVFDFNWKVGLQFSCCFIMPTLFNLTGMTFLDPLAGQFFDKIFTDAIEQREASETERGDLIDIIIKLKNDIKEDDENGLDFRTLLCQATQFFIAGFETTSSTISYALFELCRNQDAQTKLRKEIFGCIEKDGGITYENVNSMEYLKLVVQETLRKYPVLPFLDRACTMPYKLPNSNIIIEKGMRVYIPLLGLHYDPEYFPEPEQFTPERFLPENVKWPSEAYLPFGDGPRNCIGKRFGYLSVLTGLAYIISKFEVVPSKNTPKKIIFNPKAILLSSEKGIPMSFKPI